MDMPTLNDCIFFIFLYHSHNAANNIKKTANNISPVPATSLAACMKVNSCHSPALVPSLELCCVVEEFNVIIGNSVESLGTSK